MCIENKAQPVPEELRITKEQIAWRIRKYGFTEISDIYKFLESACYITYDSNAYRYIRNQIGKCLGSHDDKSDYFVPLRELACDLDCMI